MRNNEYTDLYLSWLRENISEYKVKEDVYRISLPFLDRNNDYIVLYIVKLEDGRYRISDDGSTIEELEFSGFTFTEKRKDILNATLSAFGISKNNYNELYVECSYDEIPFKKHMLAQCMIKISDMFVLSKQHIKTLFIEDVQSFLDDHEIRNIRDLSFVGMSKLTAHYDFVIPSSKRCGERLVQVVSKLDKNKAKNIIFSWNDTKGVRNNDSLMYTFIRDDEKISDDAIGALREYSIKPVFWSERNNYIDELSA